MHCRKVQQLIVAAVEGGLDTATQNVVRTHAAQCAVCHAQWVFAQKAITGLRRAPVREVPDHVWESIAAETISLPAPETPKNKWLLVFDEFSDMLRELSWPSKVAFSSACTAALVFLLVWGSFGPKQHPALLVVDVPASAAAAFPSYFREHQNPAEQPISDGEMVLAFNTMGDNH